MPKFEIEVKGKVTTYRRRKMEVWSPSEEEAIEKAKSMFVKALMRSKSQVDFSSPISAEVRSGGRKNV